MTAPRPDNEAARLEWLRQSRVLDSPREATFDDITQLTARICSVPIAAINLVDEERQWCKSSVGLDVVEIPRDNAFCAHALLDPELFIVPDTTLDERFADNPFVTGEQQFRFYAGAPLVTSDGVILGALCLIDRIPRRLDDGQKSALALLARQVVDRIELQRRIALQEILIMEREDAQLLLRRSEEELKAVIENSTDGVYLLDPVSRRVVQTNVAFRAMLGYTEQEALALSIYDIVGHVPLSIDRRLNELRSNLHLPMTERQYIRKDGAILVMESTARVARYGAGDVICVVTRDVTEQRQAEAARQAAEANYRALFEHASEGIFQTTVEGFYLQANPALARIYGYETAQQMIRELTDVGRQLYVDPARRDEFQRRMHDHGRVSRFEAQVFRRDGATIWISESARAVYDDTGMLRWYEGFVEDITERKLLEEERETPCAMPKTG